MFQNQYDAWFPLVFLEVKSNIMEIDDLCREKEQRISWPFVTARLYSNQISIQWSLEKMLQIIVDEYTEH